jgi:hypothetical protein
MVDDFMGYGPASSFAISAKFMNLNIRVLVVVRRGYSGICGYLHAYLLFQISLVLEQKAQKFILDSKKFEFCWPFRKSQNEPKVGRGNSKEKTLQ